VKVFLSWSEHRSRLAAEAFKAWIEEVLQCVEPWMSPDIDKGANWPAELSDRLETTYVGVVFLSRENLASPWLHFEVGALAKTKGGRPCIVLLDILPTDVKGPLSLYQHTQCTEEDIRRLVQNLRAWGESEGEKVISAKALDTLFNRSWPALEQSFKNVLKAGATAAGPLRTADDLSRETLTVVRSLRDEIAALRTEMSGVGIVPPRSVASPPVEGVFRIRQDVSPEQIAEMLSVSAKSFPHLRFERQNEILLVSATQSFQAQDQWAAWRKAYGSMVFAPG
jgi:TIR domain